MTNNEINRKLAGIDNFYSEGFVACRGITKETAKRFREHELDKLEWDTVTIKSYLDFGIDESDYLSKKAIELILDFMKAGI
jgi:thymidine kinase